MEDGTATARLQDEPDGRFVRLRAELGVTSFGLNQIVLRPGQRGRIHRHERQEEVYLVLDGTLSLLVEGEESTYERGDLVRVAPDVRRQLVNRGPRTLHLLAIGGAGEHEGRDGAAYAAWEDAESRSPQEMPMPEDLPESERRS
jgi:uncharacterized cupin superfamily protein